MTGGGTALSSRGTDEHTMNMLLCTTGHNDVIEIISCALNILYDSLNNSLKNSWSTTKAKR